MSEKIEFAIDDALSFSENLEAYRKSLEPIEEKLATVLVAELHSVIAGNDLDRDAAYDRLFSAMAEPVS